MRISKKYKSEALLILVTIIWGGTFPIIKSALDNVSPMVFLTLRFSIASIILLPFIIRKQFSSESVKAGILLGAILFISFATQTTGLKFTTATKSAFITGTTVIIVPFLQILIEKKTPTKGVIIGTILVIIGVSFLASGGNSILTLFDDLSRNFNMGDGLTMLCALSYAFYMVILDVKTHKHDFFILLFYQIATTAVLSFVFLFFFASTEVEVIKLDLSNNLIFALFYTALFATLFTTALQTKYQKNVTPAKAGIIFSFEPIFAALFAFFLLGEKISNFGYLGAVLIIFGLVFSEIYESLFLKNEK
jgi:drug/metabolite transporter (DMT)-like permease